MTSPVAAFAVFLLLVAGPVRAAVQVDARLDRSQLSVGESATLEVAVRGATGPVADPELELPRGVEVLGSARSQSFSWINGRSSSETQFRYEIGATQPGRFTIGPIRVRVGGQVYASGTVTLAANAGVPSVAGESDGRSATLLVDVTPAHPFVGQPVVLRVRLVLRASLAEEPAYTPPATIGFWVEPPSRPESYYAQQGGERVLVTETRSRLIPLGGGRATIGEASATLALTVPGSDDPRMWSGGRIPRREITVRSQPVVVSVRPLPPGAPAGFDGAVGVYDVSWGADRARTTLDVPVQVQLDVRGVGNLPLVKAPGLSCGECEVFASTVDDSFGAPGTTSPGRRRFEWNVVARRTGPMQIEPPSFSWFDPSNGSYRRAGLSPLLVEVGPAAGGGSGDRDGLPSELATRSADPKPRAPRPWAYALAGLLLGLAVDRWRAARRSGPAAPAPGADPLLVAVRSLEGPSFWRAAAELAARLERSGRPLGSLNSEIAAARYGGGAASVEAVRRKLLEQAALAAPVVVARRDPRPLAVGLAVLAVALAVVFGPGFGESRETLEVRAGDRAARDGDVGRARSLWERAWETTPNSPALAARLGWAEIRSGAIGRAAAWVLRGRQSDPRDPALEWTADRIREAGGLTGERRVPLPLRATEWAVLALVFGVVVGATWRVRRRVAWAALALTIACAGLGPLQRALERRTSRAVVLTASRLDGADVELEPGQVVRVLERAGGRVRVSAGPEIDGWLPAGAVEPVGDPS